MIEDFEVQIDEDFEQFKRDCAGQIFKIKDELCRWKLEETTDSELIQEIAKIIFLDDQTIETLRKAGVEL